MNIPAKNILTTGRILVFASACLFAGMIYFLSGTLSFLDNTTETAGTIVGYTQKDEAGPDGKIRTNYYPVIEYRDNKNRALQFNYDTPMNNEVALFIKAGESQFKDQAHAVPQVKIRYSNLNPADVCHARSFFDTWGATIAYGFLALLFSFTGTALMQKGDEEILK